MRFGPTSLQINSVLARGHHRPKLRADLRISEQTVGGAISFVIKIPESASYNRYGAYEYELLQLCDGTRTPAEIAAEMSERHPEKSLEETEVLEFLDGMEPAMWERSLGEKNLAILEKIRDERKTRLNKSSLLYITFKAWDPDKTLARMDQFLSWLYTREFVIFSLILFGIGAVIWASDFARIRQDTLAFYSFSNKSAADLWMLWILYLVIGGIHEFGHGLTCRHYGGEVHQMGFMLIYLTPAFYVDTTDVYLFSRAAPRQWTIFAGIWIELVLCGLASIVWYFSLPGSFISGFSYKILLLSGISGALLNLNPLMKADGYYALSQYLEMESLREDSFAYLLAWFRKTILRQNVELPPVTSRRRRIFLTFASLALIYSTGIIVLGILFLKNIFVGWLGTGWGYLVTATVTYMFLRRRIQEAWPALRARLQRVREKLMAWRITRAQQVTAAAIVLLMMAPLTSKVATDFVLEPGERAQVRAPAPGRVSEVRVREGDHVTAGAVLAVLRNRELEARASILERQLTLAANSQRSAQSRREPAEIARSNRERQRLEVELNETRTKLAGLVLRAPFDGVVTTAEIEERVGEYLNGGDEFTGMANRGQMRARILVRDWELEDVALGAPAKLKVESYPFRTFSGRVEQILPAAALDRPVASPEKVERYGQELTNYFAVVLTFENKDGLLREGMTGTAKISGKRYPLAWRATRGVWRWLRSQIW